MGSVVSTRVLFFFFFFFCKRFTKGPYSNFTNFTTQIKVNNKYNIKNVIKKIFIFSYTIIGKKFELLIFEKMFFLKTKNKIITPPKNTSISKKKNQDELIFKTKKLIINLIKINIKNNLIFPCFLRKFIC